MILLPQPGKCWDYRHAPPHLSSSKVTQSVTLTFIFPSEASTKFPRISFDTFVAISNSTEEKGKKKQWKQC
jgi:hypothetical protein